MKRTSSLLLLACLLVLAACDGNRVYQQTYDFDDNGWHMDSIPSFTFEIEDSNPKNLILNLRNGIAYEWHNVYLNYSLQDSTGKELASDLINIELFDPKTGEPRGEGSSIYQQGVDLLQDYRFPYRGKFTFSVTQYMREMELKEILSVGLRVEEDEE